MLGLVGGCISKKTGIGIILMAFAAVLQIVALIFLGFNWMVLVSIVLFVVGAIIGFVTPE
ncbi:MAG: hypothetical protein SOW55_05340 [Bacilli bacterium]|nr:hypothetical protein [Bacillales bacterium]MDY2575371.1 hypothetical protein [Bacilli bacterium]